MANPSYGKFLCHLFPPQPPPKDPPDGGDWKSLDKDKDKGGGGEDTTTTTTSQTTSTITTTTTASTTTSQTTTTTETESTTLTDTYTILTTTTQTTETETETTETETSTYPTILTSTSTSTTTATTETTETDTTSTITIYTSTSTTTATTSQTTDTTETHTSETLTTATESTTTATESTTTATESTETETESTSTETETESTTLETQTDEPPEEENCCYCSEFTESNPCDCTGSANDEGPCSCDTVWKFCDCTVQPKTAGSCPGGYSSNVGEVNECTNICDIGPGEPGPPQNCGTVPCTKCSEEVQLDPAYPCDQNGVANVEGPCSCQNWRKTCQSNGTQDACTGSQPTDCQDCTMGSGDDCPTGYFINCPPVEECHECTTSPDNGGEPFNCTSDGTADSEGECTCTSESSTCGGTGTMVEAWEDCPSGMFKGGCESATEGGCAPQPGSSQGLGSGESQSSTTVGTCDQDPQFCCVDNPTEGPCNSDGAPGTGDCTCVYNLKKCELCESGQTLGDCRDSCGPTEPDLTNLQNPPGAQCPPPEEFFCYTTDWSCDSEGYMNTLLQSCQNDLFFEDGLDCAQFNPDGSPNVPTQSFRYEDTDEGYAQGRCEMTNLMTGMCGDWDTANGFPSWDAENSCCLTDAEATCEGEPPGAYKMSQCFGNAATCVFDSTLWPDSTLGYYESKLECQCTEAQYTCGNIDSCWNSVTQVCESCDGPPIGGSPDGGGGNSDYFRRFKGLVDAGHGTSKTQYSIEIARKSRKSTSVFPEFFNPPTKYAPVVKVGTGRASIWSGESKRFIFEAQPMENSFGFMELTGFNKDYSSELIKTLNPYHWMENELVDTVGWSKYFDGNVGFIGKSSLDPQRYFYLWPSLYGSKLNSRMITRGKMSLVAMDAPAKTGSVFVREPSPGDVGGYDTYVVMGTNHSIQLAEGDSFDLVNGKGQVIFGTGRIYYEADNRFNFSRFEGAILTEKGVYIVSERGDVVLPQTVGSLKIRNDEHLQNLRKFDPYFLVPAFSTRLQEAFGERRLSQHEVNPEGRTKFSSHQDPGFYYTTNMLSPYFLRNKSNLEDKRFGFGLPTRHDAILASRDFVPYNNFATWGNTIFKKVVHRGVAAVLEIMEKERPDYDTHYLYDMSNTQIYRSLKTEVAKLFENIRDIADRKVPRNKFMESISTLMLNGRIQDYDINYFKKLYSTKMGLTERPGDYLRTLTPIAANIDSRYGFTAGQIREQRIAKKRKVRVRKTSSLAQSSDDVLNIILKNIKPMDYRKYGDPDSKEKLKRWHILPQDIRMNLEAEGSLGEKYNLFFLNNQTVPFSRTTGADVSLSAKQNVAIFNAAQEVEIPLNLGNLAQSYTLSTKGKQELFDALNRQEGPIMELHTSADGSGVSGALTVSKDTELPERYFLKIQPNSIQNIDRQHEFISRTRVEYDLVTDPTEQDAVVDKNPFPYRVFYVDYDDDALAWLELQKSCVMFFDSPSLETYGPNLSINLVREIPTYIYIIPTNKTSNMPFHGVSQLNTLNDIRGRAIRSLRFVRGLDSKYANTQLKDPPGYNLTYTGNPYDPKTIDDIEYTRKSDGDEAVFTAANNYITGNQPARTMSAASKVYDVVQKLKERFILSDGLTIYDVFSRLGARTYYNLFNGEVSPFVINQMKVGNAYTMGDAATNVPWFKNVIFNNQHHAVDSYWSRSRIVRTRTGSTPTDYDKEIFDNYSDRKFSGETFEQQEATREESMKNAPKDQFLPATGREWKK